MRSRGPPVGLFGRALSGLRKGGVNPVRREAAKETQQQMPKWEETEKEEVQAQDDEVTVTPSTVLKEPEEKAEESEPTEASTPQPEAAAPERRGVRSESSDSLGGMSPSDCTTIQCRNVPPALNKKEIIEKHFSRFGKVRRVYCRHSKNLAIVHFEDHASAAKAKKKGKVLHKQELFLLWQRKKPSPGQKEQKFPEGQVEAEDQSQEKTESEATSSPLRRPPPLRPSLLDNPAAFSRSSPVKKPSMVKALQFDTEPQRDGGAEPESAERPIPSSLHHLVGQVAESAEDKYRLLEQRDKVLRQGRPKRTDLDMSKVFVGTCPDMCPEKERYMRETRKQLSIYEVIPSTEMVDHRAAVKEYSRSSADQEEPLPHELRPLPVLCMTMDYLVTQVMDQHNDNYRDWYDFVWNRTRGIRKDITQQRLCCPLTVSLIEKCTRFHVHCAHHLCEEHMSSFDAKINNENMTKCLQSLKEMYEDLAMRQVFCPQESEFRQYNVLLKLNEGDILREVQQFRDEVRKSPEVKFAVQAFAAVNSNNFVRFFKLVKRASYLASCLLHRYFNQVRAKALKSLNIAHTVGPRSTAFPVEEIARMLMFRDAAEAADFVQQYGLNVNDDVVELSRLSYQEPELPLSQKKSEVILGKKALLIGEVVNGGPLPNPPHHIPVCSFDSQSRFHGEVPLAEPAPPYLRAVADRVEVKEPPSVEVLHRVAPVGPPEPPPAYRPPPTIAEETGEPAEAYQPPAPPGDQQQLFQPISQPPPIKAPSPPPKPKPEYSEEEILAELDGVIREVVDAAVREVADAGATYTTAALRESSAQLESLLGEVLGQMLQEVSSTEVRLEQERVAEEQRKLEEARRREEHKAFLTEFSFSLCTKIVDEVLNESVQETASAEIQLAVREKAERVEKCSEQVCSGLLEETLSADIAVLVEEILEVQLQRIHKYIKRWRDVVAVRRQLKRQMRGFPAAPCCVDPRFRLKALAPSAPDQPAMEDLSRGLVNLGNAGTLSLSSTRLLKMRQAALHQMRVHCFYQQLLEESVWAPLHLPQLLTQHTPDPPERIFWKAVLLLPSDHESVASLADRILSDWLEVKFGGEKTQRADGAMQTLCVSSSLQEHQRRTHRVHVSIKACRGPLTADGLSKVEEGSELQGATALLLLLPAPPAAEPSHDEQDVPLLSALLQLKQLQQASAWHCPLPLAVLVPGPDGGDAETLRLEEALKLDTLLKEGLISQYSFFFIPETTSDLQGTKQLNQAVSWLLPRAPPPCLLSCQTLLQLVEGCMTHVFIPRVAANCQDRAEASLPSQDPAPIIHFYNSLLAHIAEQVSSEELCKLSWPPAEFCMTESLGPVPPLGWNSAEQLAWLQETVLSLQLPAFETPSETASWSEVCSSVLNYADQIKLSSGSRTLLISQLENLLQRVRLKAWQAERSKPTPASRKGAEVLGVGGAYRTLPWDSVLGIFMDYKLKDWQPPGPPVCEDALTEDGEILVYCFTDMLKDFQPPEEWTQAVNKTHREKQQEKEGASSAASFTPSGQLVRQLFHGEVAPQEAAPAAPLDITHTATAQELLAHRVREDLEEEKAESKRTTEQLQRWLDGEAVDHLSTPLLIPSSNILCMPLTMRTPQAAKTRQTPETLEPEPEELSAGAAGPTSVPVPISWRLKQLQQQIQTSREEEVAWRLKLSNLMSIVDD